MSKKKPRPHEADQAAAVAVDAGQDTATTPPDVAAASQAVADAPVVETGQVAAPAAVEDAPVTQAPEPKKLSLGELRKVQDELQRQMQAVAQSIAAAQAESRRTIITQVRALVREHNLQQADVFPVGRAAADAGAPKAKGKGIVEAKFHDQETGDVWSGRGLKPRWLTARLDAGANLEDFRITKP